MGDAKGHVFRSFDVVTDYKLHVDRKPRYEGVGDFLKSRALRAHLGADVAAGLATLQKAVTAALAS